MPSPREPIFLGRETYRRRRLIDAMRLLPVVGLLLFLAPLLGGGVTGYGTASLGVFLFAAWFGLIVAAAVLVRILSRAPGGVAFDPLEPDAAPPGDEAESGGA
ncbi:hypothetical protein [Sinisalibacter aestuarii]|uniref:hypothetical protein n=1 Tax=Sinisalibacter aestuarii TaxID=2949426 RepID=UPI00248FA597|nr:hypothetical protein [Sinisalibacter aestuarii]